MENRLLATLSDHELLVKLARVASSERALVVDLIELLGEVDARRLYLPEGCSSLFTYCTTVLKFADNEAYFRIESARAARQFPVILDRLRDGSMSLTTIKLVRPHLTNDNVGRVIAAAAGKSKREVEQLVAGLAPKPDAKPILRRLPEPPRAAAEDQAESLDSTTRPEAPEPAVLLTPAPASPRSISAPLSSDRYLLRVTLSADAHAKLRRAQNLMRHTDPTGDLAIVIDRALKLLVDDLERHRMAHVKKPRELASVGTSKREYSRYVPAAVRRAVWTRDEGRCAFVGNRGRCCETGALELHHVEPFSFGGPTTTANLELRCRAHNQYEGALLFDWGRNAVDSH